MNTKISESNTQEIAKQIVALIDLTSLNTDDTALTVETLCKKVNTTHGNVAAICIYSHFVPLAKQYLADNTKPIQIATVVNFPAGLPDIQLAVLETELALSRGADEIDLVLPYHALLKNNTDICAQMVREVKTVCHNKVLKVIIESGMLGSAKLIAQASLISINNGADFIKTSTGKVAVNATLDAAKVILTTIHDSGETCGFKASGGIKTMDEAQKYLSLASVVMGNTWINSRHFRFGASALLDEIIIAGQAT